MRYYHYKQTGLSGNCEVCGTFTGSLIYEREERDYTLNFEESKTYDGCENKFICERCKRG